MTANPSDARRKTAQAMQDLLLQVADDVRTQQQEIRRKLPRMSSLPAPLQVDPDAIRRLTQSQVYKKAVEEFVQGKAHKHILITVLRLLREFLPDLIGHL